MMKQWISSFLSSQDNSGKLQAKTSTDRILGRYINESADFHIAILKASDTYCGELVWVNPNCSLTTDQNNPNRYLRYRQLQGIPILSGLTFNGSCWGEGKIYNPLDGKYGECEVTLTADGDLHVTIRYSLLSTTKVWRRI
ncbi:MAG: hypothetical protein CL843_17685 [Crocinitomicaceae bacterium]|nr:hypothetical protein [Crocinitomicaceae bacterium]|tara:strand:- start:29 stop:448 length:420 start_codon:yes stop_codon:yes gene_type:complete